MTSVSLEAYVSTDRRKEPCSAARQLPDAAPAGARAFLLISAPFGPFGRELAGALRREGARAMRVILNGGDLLDWGLRDRLTFLGPSSDWALWLEQKVLENQISDIVTYGDSSLHAAVALRLAERLGLRSHVMEQGYFRPDWVTLERGGVNANSALPRDPAWYHERAAATATPPAHSVGRSGPAAIARITAYHIAVYAAAPLFRRYRASYREPAVKQAIGHVERFARQLISNGRQRRQHRRAMSASGPVFLCALQRPGDSQLWRHSSFAEPRAFVEHVVESFARNAHTHAHLVIRPHPLDPGLIPHAAVVVETARRLHVAGRVSFVDQGKLHEILPRVAGVVCVNSTAGLAAIEFGKPTVTLGKAIYDMPGLTHQGGLDTFWTCAEAPDASLFEAFRRVIVAETQVNGGFATSGGRRMAVPTISKRLLAA